MYGVWQQGGGSAPTHLQIMYTHMFICMCSNSRADIHTHTNILYMCIRRIARTGRRRLVGSPKLQNISHKRATKYRSLLRKMTIKVRDPMSLRHPVYTFAYPYIHQNVYMCTYQSILFTNVDIITSGAMRAVHGNSVGTKQQHYRQHPAATQCHSAACLARPVCVFRYVYSDIRVCVCVCVCVCVRVYRQHPAATQCDSAPCLARPVCVFRSTCECVCVCVCACVCARVRERVGICTCA